MFSTHNIMYAGQNNEPNNLGPLNSFQSIFNDPSYLKAVAIWSVIAGYAIGIATPAHTKDIIIRAIKYAFASKHPFEENLSERFDTIPVAASAVNPMRLMAHRLNNSKQYIDMGAKNLQIIGLHGPSQLDQEILARALAGETGSSFFQIQSQDLFKRNNLYGLVYDLVNAASWHSWRSGNSSIIFIQYCDISNMQFLIQFMQKILNNKKIIIVVGMSDFTGKLGQTHQLIKQICKEEIYVGNPDSRARILILKEVLQNFKTVLNENDLKKIAHATKSFYRESLIDLFDRAAILAAQKNVEFITATDIFDAITEVNIGKKNEDIVLNEQKRLETAYHESGHALMLLLFPKMSLELHQVTICPHESSLGLTTSLLKDETVSTLSKEDMLHRVMFFLGGRAAEELIFGLISTGASDDFEQATKTVRAMICTFGMTDEFGMVARTEDTNSKEINDLIKKILDELYLKVMNLLQENRHKLDLLAQTLAERETMYAEEVYELLGITFTENY